MAVALIWKVPVNPTAEGSERKHQINHHGRQCGDCWGEEEIRGLNGNGKKYNKD